MNISDLIDSRAVLANVKAPGKKQLLNELSHLMSRQTGIDARSIFETMLRREKLGSTGIGQGIAIPHGKIGGLKKVHCLFARLATPLEFDSADGQPVDLVFMMLAPEDAGADHLKALARISRVLREGDTISKLRGTDTAEGLYAILTEPRAASAA
ncbi:MAG: PTS IIA-like nitrogen regulatory protein PtsN [Rhizobiales bacterium]|nr:PTS IIA-like nitrogen regulatory protein PtsN [Hyphomicrobiales bacterium]